MAVKTFAFSAKPRGRKAPARKNIPFKLDPDGEELHVRGEVNEDGLGVISAMFARAESKRDPAGMADGLFETLETLFTPETVQVLLTKVKAPKSVDPFGFDELAEVIEWAIEETTSRPTTSSRT